MATRKWLVTEDEFKSARVENGDLKFTRDNGEVINAGRVVGDVTPELAALVGQAEGYKDSAEESKDLAALYAANSVQLQDGTVTSLLADRSTQSGALVRAELTERVQKRPVSRLNFVPKPGTAFRPLSVGPSGYTYAMVDGSNAVYRSNDGLNTADQGINFSTVFGDTKVLVAAGESAEGFWAVTNQYEGNLASIYFSTTWSSGWAKVMDVGNVEAISVDIPKYTPDGTVILIGEYGNDDQRHVYLSRDGGETYTNIFTATRQVGGVNNHIHHATYDPQYGRIWVSVGDGGNCWFGYSDDWGATWVDVPAVGVGPEVAGTDYNHPTIVTPTSSRLVTTPDGAGLGNGVWEVDKRDGSVSIAHEFSADEPYRAWARPPWGQRGWGDVDELYIQFVPTLDVIGERQVRVIGTGDGGVSWHDLWVEQFDLDTDAWPGGIVGPDNSGRIYMLGRMGDTGATYIAQAPKWESVTTTAQAVSRDLRTVASGTTLERKVDATTSIMNLDEQIVPRDYLSSGFSEIAYTVFGEYRNTLSTAVDLNVRLSVGTTQAYRTATISIPASSVSGARGYFECRNMIRVVPNGGRNQDSSYAIVRSEIIFSSAQSADAAAPDVIRRFVVSRVSLAGFNRALRQNVQFGSASASASVTVLGSTLEVKKRR